MYIYRPSHVTVIKLLHELLFPPIDSCKSMPQFWINYTGDMSQLKEKGEWMNEQNYQTIREIIDLCEENEVCCFSDCVWFSENVSKEKKYLTKKLNLHYFFLKIIIFRKIFWGIIKQEKEMYHLTYLSPLFHYLDSTFFPYYFPKTKYSFQALDENYRNTKDL